MAIAKQFRELIIRPALEAIGLWSQAAENLVLGTAIHESGNFKYIRQVGGGPALSFYQIEPATADDICRRYLRTRSAVAHNIAKACWPHLANPPLFSHLAMKEINNLLLTDLRFSTILCRLKYYLAKPPLPDADDIENLAAYWGAHYQSQSNPVKMNQWATSYRAHAT